MRRREFQGFSSRLSQLFSRRRFLQRFGALPAIAGLRKFPFLEALAASSQFPFEEVSVGSSGITWVHTAGKSAEKYLPETGGAGCAFLDYDNDGWMDIYLVNSGQCDFYHPSHPLRNALYHNNRDGTFTDVTKKAGVAGGGYGMGVAVGDYDGDGFPDLYVTQYRRSILYHNNGDGTFTDVTAKAGVSAPGWSYERRLVRLRQRRAAGSVCLPVSRISTSPKHAVWITTASVTTAFPNLQAAAELALSQQRRRHVYRCQQGIGNCRAFGQGLGSRGDRYQ